MIISWEQLSLSLEVNVDSSYSNISYIAVINFVVFKIFRVKNFHGFHSSQKSFTYEIFPDYGDSSFEVSAKPYNDSCGNDKLFIYKALGLEQSLSMF